MKIEVSNGDIVDKLSILQIKKEKITDNDKLEYVLKEYDMLRRYIDSQQSFSVPIEMYTRLLEVNRRLWDIEDFLREKESINEFDKEFIDNARLVYKTNDVRAELKRQINQLTDSVIMEVKSYTE